MKLRTYFLLALAFEFHGLTDFRIDVAEFQIDAAGRLEFGDAPFVTATFKTGFEERIEDVAGLFGFEHEPRA